MRLAILIVILLSSAARAGIEERYTTGQTIHVVIEAPAGTFKGFAMTESPNTVYKISDAALVSAGMTSTDGDYNFWIETGASSDTPSANIISSGVLGWTGTVERPVRSNPTYWRGTAIAAPATAGTPDVNAKRIGNTDQSGFDVAEIVNGMLETIDKLSFMIEQVSGHYRLNSLSLEVIPAGSSLTAQQTRDAMKLDPSVGAAAANSVDAKLDKTYKAARTK